MRNRVAKILKGKGIAYEDLKAALVPDRKKNEIALVFDSGRIDSSWYGEEVFKRIIPLLDPQTKNSILTGDYIGENNKQEILFEAFNESVYPLRMVNYIHSSQFFIVYINNLTDSAFKKLVDGLADYEAFIGFSDTTYQSRFKTFLSTMLVNLCVKSGRVVIQGHEDDRSDDENLNVSGYPFEENGYKCVSLQATLFDVLLSYKIERPIYPGFEDDTDFSLNAVTTNILRFDDFEIQVEEAKLNYLKSQKAGSLKYAGLEAVTKTELQDIIRGKLLSSYIYNMCYLAEHKTTKFNIILELVGVDREPFRLLASLEYQSDSRMLRLITML
jgi:hypothetical protein